MNLRVDLILPAEQRSASPISTKGLLRIAMIVIPLILFVGVASLLMKSFTLNKEVAMMQSQWEDIEPRKKQAMEQMKQFGENREIFKELEGWERAQLLWHRQLIHLMEIVPENIQLIRLAMTHQATIPAGHRKLARRFRVTLEGEAKGRNAETSVDQFKARLERSPFFSEYLESVEVSQYGAIERQDAGRFDRAFQFTCIYQPMEFSE